MFESTAVPRARVGRRAAAERGRGGRSVDVVLWRAYTGARKNTCSIFLKNFNIIHGRGGSK